MLCNDDLAAPAHHARQKRSGRYPGETSGWLPGLTNSVQESQNPDPVIPDNPSLPPGCTVQYSTVYEVGKYVYFVDTSCCQFL